MLVWSIIPARVGIQATTDSLNYTLVAARLNRPQPLANHVHIQFGKSFPKRYASLPIDPSASACSKQNPAGISISIEDSAAEWLIQAVDKNTGTITNIVPSGLRSIPDYENIVYLRLDGNLHLLDPATHKVLILFRMGNFPEVVLAEPPKTGLRRIYVAANGKQDANIYLSGNAVAAQGSGPKYSLDTKLGYLHSIGPAGSVGGTAGAIAEQGSDVDPDSVTAAATYEKVFAFPSGTGITLLSDFVGGEFDRKGNNRNLVSAFNGKLVLPSVEYRPGHFATVAILAGFEGGHNYKNNITSDGLGAFWRWLVGADAYVHARAHPLDEIMFSLEWRLRLLRDAEMFSRGIDELLTDKPRHHLRSSIDFMLSKAVGLSLKYEYGSLPPAFQFVDDKLSVGFILKIKQTNK